MPIAYAADLLALIKASDDIGGPYPADPISLAEIDTNPHAVRSLQDQYGVVELHRDTNGEYVSIAPDCVIITPEGRRIAPHLLAENPRIDPNQPPWRLERVLQGFTPARIKALPKLVAAIDNNGGKYPANDAELKKIGVSIQVASHLYNADMLERVYDLGRTRSWYLNTRTGRYALQAILADQKTHPAEDVTDPTTPAYYRAQGYNDTAARLHAARARSEHA